VTETALQPAGDALPGYVPAPGYLDEGVGADGAPRPAARASLDAVRAASDLRTLRASAQHEMRDVLFGAADGMRAFPLDPVPRVIEADEWARLTAGLEQRLCALDAFVADVYGPQHCVRDGVVPARLLGGAEYYEPELAGIRPPAGHWVGVAGFDVVRDAAGELLVLEDNLRTPSGIAYALAARRAVETVLDVPGGEAAPRPLADETVALLGSMLRAAVPPGAGTREPVIVLLTDGPENSAHWEHAWLAEALGIPLITPAGLVRRGDRLVLAGPDGRPVDVVYRRTNADRADTPLARLLLEPQRRGTLGVVNCFGPGVADDKLAQAYVEDMVRYYLGEEPRIASVRTFDPAAPEQRKEVLDRIGELVIKPRAGHGGVGVVICPRAAPAEVDRARRAVTADPGSFVAQPMIALSTHPTVVGDHLEPRHVDLRVFAVWTEHGPRVLPAALTRVAFDAGALVVNSSQNGGAKDTWVLS
jgi:uncharacterized circularly permuted ATP-grasp superfamily protein